MFFKKLVLNQLKQNNRESEFSYCVHNRNYKNTFSVNVSRILEVKAEPPGSAKKRKKNQSSLAILKDT